jgi:hypothetical protein
VQNERRRIFVLNIQTYNRQYPECSYQFQQIYARFYGQNNINAENSFKQQFLINPDDILGKISVEES